MVRISPLIVLKKTELFFHSGENVGWGRQAVSTHALSSCLNLNFPGEYLWLPFCCRDRGYTAGRQSLSCHAQGPRQVGKTPAAWACKLSPRLLLYRWRLLPGLKAPHPYWYELNEKYHETTTYGRWRGPGSVQALGGFSLTKTGERNEGFDTNRSRGLGGCPPDPRFNKTPRKRLTLYDMLGRDGLLFRFVADLIGFGGYEVNEFSAAVHHQLPRIVGHPDIWESLFDHLIDSSPGYREIIIVARRGSHRTFLALTPLLL